MKKLLIIIALLFVPPIASAKCSPDQIKSLGQSYINTIYNYSSFGADKPILEVNLGNQPRIGKSKAMAYSDGKVIILWAKAHTKCSKVQKSIIHEYIHHIDYKYNWSRKRETTAKQNISKFKDLIWKNKVKKSSFIQFILTKK